MDAAEREQIVVDWNSTPAEYPRALRIHTAFELQAASMPKSTALRLQGTDLKYQRINEDANRLSHYLIKKGVGPDMLVGVCLERSPEMVVALLAVLKTGAAYVPLDPSHPEERLAFMIEDSQLGCVITRDAVQKTLPTSVPK
jgi:non-ribosomal peptide synthetase component F